MKIEISKEEVISFIKELKEFAKNRDIYTEKAISELDYAANLKKWGTIPDDMELDKEGCPVVKSAPVDPNFRGIVK